MKEMASLERMAPEQDQRISEVVTREQARLGNFIRRRVPDPRDAEDILQDVFYELVEANRLLMPIEHITGLGPQRHVTLAQQDETEFCVGWRHSLAPAEIRELMKKVLALWVS